MSGISPAAVVYSYSELTRHLSPQDRDALAQAVEKANEDFYDDKIGIQIRKDDLATEMKKIKKRAVKNGDDKSRLESWERKIWRMFEEAGETEYAHDFLSEYLDSVYERVRAGATMLEFVARQRSYRIKTAFKPVVIVSGYPYSTGFDIRILELQQQLYDFYSDVLHRIESARNLNDIGKEHYEETMKIYIRHLEAILCRRTYHSSSQDTLVHWAKVYRTVRVLRNLFESNVPFFYGFSIAPLFSLGDLNERCNLWTPRAPEWYLRSYTPE
ncbi:hypothetical protein JCM5350_004152 [Sporobolomyces pararoseus]